MMTDQPLHAVAVAIAVDADGPLAGALILGPSGAGKSSLALALIESCPFARSALVADDAVTIAPAAGRPLASGPARLRGLIEIRGFGPAPVRTSGPTPLVVAFDLGAEASRLPEPQMRHFAAGTAPTPVYPFQWKGAEATAAARARRIAASILGGQNGRRKQDSGPGARSEGE